MLILDYLEEIYREGNVYTRIRELLCFLDYLFALSMDLVRDVQYAYLAGPHFLEGRGGRPPEQNEQKNIR